MKSISWMTIVVGVLVASAGAAVGLAVGGSNADNGGATEQRSVGDATTSEPPPIVEKTEDVSGREEATNGDPTPEDELRAAKNAHVNYYGDDRIFDAYMTISDRGIPWAVMCVERGGYVNAVFGRALKKTLGEWESVSRDNIYNIGSETYAQSDSYFDEVIPEDIYNELRARIFRCADRYDAGVGPG